MPKCALALGGDAAANPVIGVWSTTSRPTTRVLPATDAAEFVIDSSADLTQVSRLGHPLVNEVVIPFRDRTGSTRRSPTATEPPS